MGVNGRLKDAQGVRDRGGNPEGVDLDRRVAGQPVMLTSSAVAWRRFLPSPGLKAVQDEAAISSPLHEDEDFEETHEELMTRPARVREGRLRRRLHRDRDWTQAPGVPAGAGSAQQGSIFASSPTRCLRARR